MRITVVGCGALGSLFAARLGAQGHEIQVLQRPGAQFERLRRAGVEVVESDGTRTHQSLSAVASQGTALRPARLVIVLVKSYATRELDALAATLAEDGLLLTLQNGMSHVEWLAEQVGAGRLLAGTTTSGAYRDEQGVVHWGGDGQTTVGPWQVVESDAQDWLPRLFNSARFDTRWVSDPRPALWQKLALNAMTNPLSALLGRANGALAEHVALEALMRRLAEETAKAAARDGVDLEPADLWSRQQANLRATAGNRSSMLQDVLAGRPTEIEAILAPLIGSPTERIDAPVARALLSLINALTEEAATG